MPNPKRKHSHARSAKRRTHYSLSTPNLSPVSFHCARADCPQVLPSHTACPVCGMYRGRAAAVKEIRSRSKVSRQASENA